MAARICPECGNRRQLYPITPEQARRFGPRWTAPQPSAGTEFCAKCIADPPPGPPRDTAAELNHVATLCQHAAKDFVRDRTASKIAASVAFDLLRDIMVREFPGALEGRRSGAVR
jgi:hypothetical protein